MNIENAHKAMLLLDRIPKERFDMSKWIGDIPNEVRWDFAEDDKEAVICKTPACFAGNLLLAGEFNSYAEDEGWAIELQLNSSGLDPYIISGDGDIDKDVEDEDFIRWTGKFLDINNTCAKLLCGATGNFDLGLLYYNAGGRMLLDSLTRTDVQKALLLLIKSDGFFNGKSIESITNEELQTYMDEHVRINLKGPENITHQVESLLDVTRRFLR